MEEYTNELIKESSPYLLQHAHNPVNWIAWSEDLFDQAEKEGKMVLISVGYSACHWCHVMEHECFEDVEVATLMNKFFINVKVDREERPDVDQGYMTAVQLMTNKGGWPLNCFTLPDGRPIYGGTYFPKEQWMYILRSLHETFQKDREKLEDYAVSLLAGIRKSELIETATRGVRFEREKLDELILRWSANFDFQWGGGTRAPKFPLPVNYDFLLDFCINSGDRKILEFVEVTLDRMAMGGIYDQIGGGFSRYSVDMLWKIPHFEKMLYDNGQLIALYSKAYRQIPKATYQRVVYQSIDWLEREMMSREGAFFAALDADSEGVEGKFYVWKPEELQKLLGSDYEWVKDYYSLNEKGRWEEGNYVLLRADSDKNFAAKMTWSLDDLYERVNRVNEILLRARSERIRPGLDNKCLTGWNAMALRGICEAYKTFGDEAFLLLAQRNAKWILSRINSDWSVIRTERKGNPQINGFLEDYAHVIDAFLAMGEISGDDLWFQRALEITDYCVAHFRNEESKMFYFTEAESGLIARKMDVNDNVIPSGNSVMARNLYYLGRVFHKKNLIEEARQMLANVYDGMELYGSSYSNWAFILEHELYSLYEFICVGPDRKKMAMELQKGAIPFAIVLFHDQADTALPVFEGRISDQNRIYVCVEGSCLAPVVTVTEALELVIQ